MKKTGIILALVFLSLLPLSHKDVKCIFVTCAIPNLIQCYITVGKPLQRHLSGHITIERTDGETYYSGGVDSYKGEFNFAIHRDLLEKSHFTFYSEVGFWREWTGFKIDLKTIRILDKKP